MKIAKKLQAVSIFLLNTCKVSMIFPGTTGTLPRGYKKIKLFTFPTTFPHFGHLSFNPHRFYVYDRIHFFATFRYFPKN